MPAPVIYSLAIVNLVTFALFGVDKALARGARRRIPEATLLALSWATGLLGGWLAMSWFRHKTRKRSFQIKMMAVSLFNLLWPVLYFCLR